MCDVHHDSCGISRRSLSHVPSAGKEIGAQQKERQNFFKKTRWMKTSWRRGTQRVDSRGWKTLGSRIEHSRPRDFCATTVAPPRFASNTSSSTFGAIRSTFFLSRPSPSALRQKTPIAQVSSANATSAHPQMWSSSPPLKSHVPRCTPRGSCIAPQIWTMALLRRISTAYGPNRVPFVRPIVAFSY